jgi:hypothetical protein
VAALERLTACAAAENALVQDLSAQTVALGVTIRGLRSSLDAAAHRTPQLQEAKQSFVAARNFKARAERDCLFLCA